MKKLLLVSALCALLVPVSAFALQFRNMSGIVKKGASFTLITTDGNKLHGDITRLTGGIDTATLQTVNSSDVQQFIDTVIFNEGTLKVQGTLLTTRGNKASGPAEFLFQSGSTVIKGAADVKIVGPNNRNKAAVLMSFLPKSVTFGSASSIADGNLHLPAMQKAAFNMYSSGPLFTDTSSTLK